MDNPLRERQTASEWASSRQVIELDVKIHELGRLAAVLEEDLAALDPGKIPPDWRDLSIRGTLQFDLLDAGKPVPAVTGTVTAEVDVVCQRCLAPFRLTLNIEPRFMLLSSDESEASYNEYEVWELDERLLRPQDILEELLIMALPLSAMHEDMNLCSAVSSEDEHVKETTRPFAALREQMTQDN